MLPVLLDLKIIKIYTFGVFLILAFFWSVFLLWKNVRLTAHKEEEVFDGLFYCLAGGLFFGRFVHILLNYDKFGFDLVKFILINGYPGISLYGAIVGGLLGLWVYFQAKKIKYQEMVDYFVAPLFLAIAIGKLGAFFSGVEVGAKTSFFLAIKYANFSGFRHITSLYESFFFFLGAFLSQKLLFQIRRGGSKKGTGIYFFFWYFSLIYVLFDPFKSVHGNLFGHSFNEVVSGVLLLTVTIYFLYHYRDLILKKTQMFINYLYSHGYGTFQAVRRSTRKKTKRGEGQNS